MELRRRREEVFRKRRLDLRALRETRQLRVQPSGAALDVRVIRTPRRVFGRVHAVPQHERQRVSHLVLRLARHERRRRLLPIPAAVAIPAALIRVHIHQCGDDAWRLEPRADEQEDGHDVPHLVVQKRGANEVQHVHVAAAVGACPMTAIVVVERGDVRAQDAPPEGRELFCGVELAQVAKVVLADEPRRAVPHRRHVEVARGEEVLVVSRTAREARGEGGRDGRPGVDADRGGKDGVERVEVSKILCRLLCRCRCLYPSPFLC